MMYLLVMLVALAGGYYALVTVAVGAAVVQSVC
jgi:hypothetical protein